jgi:hypothetical protein
MEEEKAAAEGKSEEAPSPTKKKQLSLQPQSTDELVYNYSSKKFISTLRKFFESPFKADRTYAILYMS